jgi:hypothetical protein
LPEGFERDYDTKHGKDILLKLDKITSKTNIRKVYNIGRNLGGGYFGMVRQATLLSDKEGGGGSSSGEHVR